MSDFKLELLRHGESNNQLLSPLTPYIALLENDPAVSVHLSYAHAQLLRKLQALNYQESERGRIAALEELSVAMSEIWSQIPGFSGQLANFQTPGRAHFRVVLSAAELALLPLELSSVPKGLVSGFQNLLLSPQDIALTRESRRRGEQCYEPPDKAKVLFAFAQAGGEVPSKAHGKALLDSVLPWLKDKSAKTVARYLRVLPDATAASLQAICAEEAFTHVHLLAHGAEQDDGIDRRFGLALHTADGIDIVSPDRIVAAICAGKTRHSVQVVSVASCQGGQQGGVIGVGGSVAQALHQAGVPMVLASQFPLTFVASVLIAKVLFPGLLWGEDPRWLVCRIRRELFTQLPKTHDWASLVHYFSAGLDLNRRVLDNRVKRAIGSVNCALDIVGRLPVDAGKEVIDIELSRMQKARERLLRIAEREAKELSAANDARVSRRIASTDQLIAELQQRLGLTDEVRSTLCDARKRYRDSYKRDPNTHWALLLDVSLSQVLHVVASEPAIDGNELSRSLEKIRALATSCTFGDDKSQAWAHADLIALALTQSIGNKMDVAALKRDAVGAAQSLKQVCKNDLFPWYSTRRQTLRYTKLFIELASNDGQREAFAHAHEIADAVLEVLTEIQRPEYGGY